MLRRASSSSCGRSTARDWETPLSSPQVSHAYANSAAQDIHRVCLCKLLGHHAA